MQSELLFVLARLAARVGGRMVGYLAREGVRRGDAKNISLGIGGAVLLSTAVYIGVSEEVPYSGRRRIVCMSPAEEEALGDEGLAQILAKV
jgi:hypothetical protein